MIQIKRFLWSENDIYKTQKKGFDNVDNGFTRMHRFLNSIGRDRIIQITAAFRIADMEYTIIYEDDSSTPDVHYNE